MKPSKTVMKKHAEEMFDLLEECQGRLLQRGYFGIAYDIDALFKKMGVTNEAKEVA